MDDLVAKRIAIIPARGGSKRIPDKNIMDFMGKPIIGWTIQAAIDSGSFDRILVSTDVPEIATISHQLGAEAPFLRRKFADDYSSASDATIHSLRQASEYWGESYDTVVQLMANCPMRTSGDIRNSLQAFEKVDNDFQISCFKFGWMNPWWAVTLDNANHPESLFPEARNSRSQDLPNSYCPSGAIWIAKADSLLSHGTFYGPHHVFHELSLESSVDIDDQDDLTFASALFAIRADRGHS